MKCHIHAAGVTFDNRQGYLCHLEQNAPDVYFFLRREPKNEYDSNAIAIIGHNMKTNKYMQVGYVPKKQAEALAPIMDQGYRPRVSKPTFVGGQGFTRGLQLDVYI